MIVPLNCSCLGSLREAKKYRVTQEPRSIQKRVALNHAPLITPTQQTDLGPVTETQYWVIVAILSSVYSRSKNSEYHINGGYEKSKLRMQGQSVFIYCSFVLLQGRHPSLSI
jgi:hypothetical protein